MKRFFLVLIFLATTPRLFSQDLDRLRERSSALWAERVKGDRARALQYVLQATRSDFSMHEEVREAKVIGFEFQEDRSKVLVTAKAKMNLLPPFDKLEKNIAEIWEWTSGNWFLRAVESDPNAFSDPTSPPLVSRGTAPPPKFDLVEDQLDLGRHRQGDKVAGTVHFTATRSQVHVFRAKGIPGLNIKQPRWDSDTGGAIDFVIDTTLLAADSQLTAVFAAVGLPVGTAYPTSEDSLRVNIGITGQVRVEQTPKVIDPKQAGRAEILIQNVSDKPFSLKGIQSTNPLLTADGDVPPSLAVGQTVKLEVQYPASSQPLGGELLFMFSPGVLPADSLVFPLSFVAPEPTPPQPAFTREQLDEIVRQRRGGP